MNVNAHIFYLARFTFNLRFRDYVSADKFLGSLLRGGGERPPSPEPEPSTVNDVMMIEADLLLSNPYKGAIEKLSALKEMKETIRQTAQTTDNPAASDQPVTSGASSLGSPSSPETDVRGGEQPGSGVPTTEPFKLDMAEYFPLTTINRISSTQSETRKDGAMPESRKIPGDEESQVRLRARADSTRNIRTDTMDNSMRGTKGAVDDKRNVLVREIYARRSHDDSENTMDMLYLRLKSYCKRIDSFQPVANVTTPRGNTHRNFHFSTKNPLKRIFGNGRIDGTNDFVRLNFPVDLDNEANLNGDNEEQSTAMYKSTLFIRRHTIWFAFYTANYAVKGVLSAEGLFLFVPKKDDGSSDQKFILEIQLPFEKNAECKLTPSIY